VPNTRSTSSAIEELNAKLTGYKKAYDILRIMAGDAVVEKILAVFNAEANSGLKEASIKAESTADICMYFDGIEERYKNKINSNARLKTFHKEMVDRKEEISGPSLSNEQVGKIISGNAQVLTRLSIPADPGQILGAHRALLSIIPESFGSFQEIIDAWQLISEDRVKHGDNWTILITAIYDRAMRAEVTTRFNVEYSDVVSVMEVSKEKNKEVFLLAKDADKNNTLYALAIARLLFKAGCSSASRSYLDSPGLRVSRLSWERLMKINESTVPHDKNISLAQAVIPYALGSHDLFDQGGGGIAINSWSIMDAFSVGGDHRQYHSELIAKINLGKHEMRDIAAIKETVDTERLAAPQHWSDGEIHIYETLQSAMFVDWMFLHWPRIDDGNKRSNFINDLATGCLWYSKESASASDKVNNRQRVLAAMAREGLTSDVVLSVSSALPTLINGDLTDALIASHGREVNNINFPVFRSNGKDTYTSSAFWDTLTKIAESR